MSLVKRGAADLALGSLGSTSALPTFALFCIEAVLLVKLMCTEQSTELLVAICVIAVLTVVAGRDPKAISLGKDGLKIELRQLRQRVTENKSAITELTVLSMGAETLFNLEKVATGHFGSYHKMPFRGLETELYYLRNRGFIRLKANTVPSIHEIPTEGDDLSQYVEVTDEGRRYLELRKRVSASSGPDTNLFHERPVTAGA